ncbi:DUF3006 family protein [Haloplanus litoreus]|uniref:DUF3006 family protein n=1 Tax=Haloplanus litoreus TaxID=767515 RepID=A0ABD5ZUE8_9EURY
MIPDGTYRAVVDRIEDGLATLEVEREDGCLVALTVEATALPPAARTADAVLTVTLEDGALASARHDPSGTAARRRALRERFERLSSRPPEADDESES